MAWFDDLKTPSIKVPKRDSRDSGNPGDSSTGNSPDSSAEGRSESTAARVSRVPEGLWVKCTQCGDILQSKVLRSNLSVCPDCQFHFRVGAYDRVQMLCDEGAFEEYGAGLVSNDPLQFDDRKSYKERLKAASDSTGLNDAFYSGKARLKGLPYHLGVFEFKFMGGSMGSVVGEKVALVFDHALKDKLPAVVVSSSGGARMQEGILSLMQMAKTTGLISEMRRQGLPYFSILTDPTTGGVAASFAMLGDVILAEPGALIGFAGPRVIEQTIRQSLPPGFQRSEFLLQHGFVDRIVHRKDLGTELHQWMLRLGFRTCRFPKKT